MKTLLWSLTTLFALIWSGLAWASAAVVRWTVDALSSGRAAELGQVAVDFKLPPWLEPFFDTGLITFLQNLTQWVLEMAGSGAPLAGAVVGWLVPLVWVIWAVGLFTALAIAAVLHLLILKVPRTGVAKA